MNVVGEVNFALGLGMSHVHTVDCKVFFLTREKNSDKEPRLISVFMNLFSP